MTINAILTTPDQRQPVYLVKFSYNGIIYAYTTHADNDVTVAGLPYVRIPITVDELAGSVSESVNEGTITLPSDNPVVAWFDAFLPVEPVLCSIYYMEANDSSAEVRLVKSGKVTTVVDQDDYTTQIKVRPLSEALTRAVPWQQEQVNCPLALYSQQCSVISDNFKVTAVGLSAMSGASLTSPAFVNADTTYFQAGFIKNRRTREIRFVINQSGGTLQVSYPFVAGNATDTYDAYAGCMKTGDICQNKFNNKINFMGFEFIPTKNMFKTGIN